MTGRAGGTTELPGPPHRAGGYASTPQTGNHGEQSSADGDGVAAIRYLIHCVYCQAPFDLFAAPWCRHRSNQPSKLCPECERCLCDHPSYDHPWLWKEAPLVFRKRGFRRLFVLYV